MREAVQVSTAQNCSKIRPCLESLFCQLHVKLNKLPHAKGYSNFESLMVHFFSPRSTFFKGRFDNE